MADINPNDFIWSFSCKTRTKDWDETRLMVRASSRVPFFHLCDDWLTDHRCSVPIQKKNVYQPLIKFSFLYYVPG